MGWLRLLGSSNLQVSFAKEPYKRDYILQKRPILLKSLLIIATPQPLSGERARAKKSEREREKERAQGRARDSERERKKDSERAQGRARESKGERKRETHRNCR